MTVVPQVLGWKERVALPQWDLELRAKLDTGARTSALHVRDIELLHPDGGEHPPADDHPRADDASESLRVRFDVVLGTKRSPEHHPIEADVIAFKMVRDTGARAERRPVVRTTVIIGATRIDTDVTLTDRTGMNFRMLLGRRTLERHCVVDPAHGYLAGRPRWGAGH